MISSVLMGIPLWKFAKNENFVRFYNYLRVHWPHRWVDTSWPTWLWQFPWFSSCRVHPSCKFCKYFQYFSCSRAYDLCLRFFKLSKLSFRRFPNIFFSLVNSPAAVDLVAWWMVFSLEFSSDVTELALGLRLLEDRVDRLWAHGEGVEEHETTNLNFRRWTLRLEEIFALNWSTFEVVLLLRFEILRLVASDEIVEVLALLLNVSEGVEILEELKSLRFCEFCAAFHTTMLAAVWFHLFCVDTLAIRWDVGFSSIFGEFSLVSHPKVRIQWAAFAFSGDFWTCWSFLLFVRLTFISWAVQIFITARLIDALDSWYVLKIPASFLIASFEHEKVYHLIFAVVTDVFMIFAGSWTVNLKLNDIKLSV